MFLLLYYNIHPRAKALKNTQIVYHKAVWAETIITEKTQKENIDFNTVK